MLVTFPTPPSGQYSSFLSQTLDTIRQAFNACTSSQQVSAKVILQSPNGTSYDVTVSDAGALVVTQSAKR